MSTPRAPGSFIQESIPASQNNVPECPAPLIHIGVICDACDEIIVGSRHKCLTCHGEPHGLWLLSKHSCNANLDFDLCDNCYPSSSTSHNRHDFITIKDPSSISIDRVRGNGPAHPARNRPRQPTNVAHQAICDLCDSRIQGIRYVRVRFIMCPAGLTDGVC